MSTLELMKTVRLLCGGLMACRKLGSNKYEITLSNSEGKQRILEGFSIDSTRVDVTDLCRDEVMVSFLQLPAYVTDKEILDKLILWGVTPVSPIKRRMWPRTNAADGTRFVMERLSLCHTQQSLTRCRVRNITASSITIRRGYVICACFQIM